MGIEKMFMENDQRWQSEPKVNGMKIIAVDTAPFKEDVKDVWKDFAQSD